MTQYVKHFNPTQTPQSEQAKPGQIKNAAGGYVFDVGPWTMLDRFILLGAEQGTYYASEREMTRDNAKNVLECLKLDGKRTVARIVEISDAGRAPKNDPAIFALALAAADDNAETRKEALAALPKVCRIPTHLFSFIESTQAMRGWGPSLRRAIANWYGEKAPEKLAMQVLKYQSRNKWSHKDVLRLSHAVAPTPVHAAIYEWIRAGMDGFQDREVKRKGTDRIDRYEAAKKDLLPRILPAYEEMKAAKSDRDVVRLIKEYGFTREMVPTEHLNSVEVWEALLEDMPMTAMIRNLGKMTSIGLIKTLSRASAKVCENLSNRDALKKARVHPIQMLSALRVYSQGHGEKGSLTWQPERAVVDALDEAFYTTFDTIEPTNKAWLLGIDISGSMDGGVIAGVPGLTPRMAAAAMAMVTARTEKRWGAIGFTTRPTALTVSPKQRLDDVMRYMQGLPMGGTDCAQPIIWALQNKTIVDVFATYSDNESWSGGQHTFEALNEYRRKINPKAKLVTIDFTATRSGIGDVTDPGTLACVGMDTATPALVSAFVSE